MSSYPLTHSFTWVGDSKRADWLHICALVGVEAKKKRGKKWQEGTVNVGVNGTTSTLFFAPCRVSLADKEERESCVCLLLIIIYYYYYYYYGGAVRFGDVQTEKRWALDHFWRRTTCRLLSWLSTNRRQWHIWICFLFYLICVVSGHYYYTAPLWSGFLVGRRRRRERKN